MLTGVAGAALANACAHPVLVGRARELGARGIVKKCLERRLADGDRVRISWVLETVLERLSIKDGDVEEGGGGAACGGGNSSSSVDPRFYSFKWGVHGSLSRWIPGPPFLAWWRSVGRRPVDFRSISRYERRVGLVMVLVMCCGITAFLRVKADDFRQKDGRHAEPPPLRQTRSSPFLQRG